MTAQQKCQKDEQRGRAIMISYLQQIGITDITPTTDEYDSVDLFFTSKKGNKVAVEVKTRDPKYEGYPTYILEQIKYDGMKERMNESGATIGLYVFIFNSHIYIYNIEDIVASTEPVASRMKANSYSNRYKSKQIYYFDKDLAIMKAQFTNNKWKRL